MKGLIIDDTNLETGYIALTMQTAITAVTAGVTTHTYLEEGDPAAATVNTLITAGVFVMITLLSGMMVKDAVNRGESA